MLYFTQGDAIILRNEFLNKSVEELPKFFNDLDRGKAKPISFSTGSLTAKNVHRGFSVTAGGQVVPWTPIGPGKPLTVMIREIYTGEHPASFWGGNKDILVASAVKAISTFDAQPRAINFLERDVGPYSRLYRPKATNQGTPLVFYTPALVDNSLTLTMDVVFDKWDLNICNQIGNAFTAAAGVPIFLPYSIYMLAASAIVKLAGNAGEALFDGKPSFSATEGLDFQLPGGQQLLSGFMLVTQSDVDAIDPAFRNKYHVNNAGQVVDAAGKQYKGSIPYIVICLDGAKNEQYSSWTPTAASAAVLGRFLGMNNGQSQPMNILVDAIRLYNDFTFRQKVDKLDKQIAVEKDASSITMLQQQREAAVKNIVEEILKPKP
jgi:hypothetical protein